MIDYLVPQNSEPLLGEHLPQQQWIFAFSMLTEVSPLHPKQYWFYCVFWRTVWTKPLRFALKCKTFSDLFFKAEWKDSSSLAWKRLDRLVRRSSLYTWIYIKPHLSKSSLNCRIGTVLPRRCGRCDTAGHQWAPPPSGCVCKLWNGDCYKPALRNNKWLCNVTDHIILDTWGVKQPPSLLSRFLTVTNPLMIQCSCVMVCSVLHPQLMIL